MVLDRPCVGRRGPRCQAGCALFDGLAYVILNDGVVSASHLRTRRAGASAIRRAWTGPVRSDPRRGGAGAGERACAGGVMVDAVGYLNAALFFLGGCAFVLGGLVFADLLNVL